MHIGEPENLATPLIRCDTRKHLTGYLVVKPIHRKFFYKSCIFRVNVPPISITLISRPQLLEVCVKITNGNNKVFWRRVRWYIVTHVSEELSGTIFRVIRTDHEGGGRTVCTRIVSTLISQCLGCMNIDPWRWIQPTPPKVSKYLRIDKASHLRKLEPSP